MLPEPLAQPAPLREQLGQPAELEVNLHRKVEPVKLALMQPEGRSLEPREVRA